MFKSVERQTPPTLLGLELGRALLSDLGKRVRAHEKELIEASSLEFRV